MSKKIKVYLDKEQMINLIEISSKINNENFYKIEYFITEEVQNEIKFKYNIILKCKEKNYIEGSERSLKHILKIVMDNIPISLKSRMENNFNWSFI